MLAPTSTPELSQVQTLRRAPTYVDLRVRAVLQREPTPQGWRWAVNPYQGCALGCTFCNQRLDQQDFSGWLAFEKRIALKSNAVEVLKHELRALGSLDRPIVLGSSTEPWQPAEEHFRLTRSILGELAEHQGVELVVYTRSSLIARDADLLRTLSRKERVTVVFSIGSLDERVNRLLEPRAPQAFRRLAALEALSRAGVRVGLAVSPVMPGLDEEELGLEPLLSRAAHAGARFASIQPVQFSQGQRENFLTHVTSAYPELASRFRRVLGRRAPTEEEQLALKLAFARLCERVGLLPVGELPSERPAHPAPAQLPLFDPLGC